MLSSTASHFGSRVYNLPERTDANSKLSGHKQAVTFTGGLLTQVPDM